MGRINRELGSLKLKVVHGGFKVKVFPDAGELAVARASGENPAKEPFPG